MGAVLLVLTAGAVGGGWMLGSMLGTEAGEARATAAEATANAQAAEFESALALYPMPVMSTALAAPSDVWVRLEATLLFDEKRQIVEGITDRIVVGNSEISIHLAYLSATQGSSQDTANRVHNPRGTAPR